jgi:photosystem II stability/assembly factor-like uncharacterized protein
MLLNNRLGLSHLVVIQLIVAALLLAQTGSWNPVPPTDSTVSINDMCVLGNGLNGWAVGTTGAGGESFTAIFRTTDGSSWSYLPFPDSTTAGLQGVCFVTSTLGWVVGSQGAVYKTTNGGTTWSRQTAPTSRNLVRINFIDTLRGWATGGWNDATAYLVLRTTNGGTTWQDLSFGSDCYSSECIYFVDGQNGWIGGLDRALAAHIHRTTDGGVSWTRQSVPAGVGYAGGINEIDFPVNSNIGWAASSSLYDPPYGEILYTTDGGTTWGVQLTTNLTYNDDLDAQDNQRVTVASVSIIPTRDAKIFVTSNGGQNWSSYAPPVIQYIYAIQYVGNSIWFAPMASQIFKSTDNGATWAWCFNAPSYNSIAWRDSLNAYAVSGSDAGTDGYTIRTTNGGNSWFYHPGTPGGKQIIFLNASRGWILKEGNSAGVYRTTNGGVIWAYNPIGAGAWVGRIFFATQDSGWAVGGSGTVRVTADGGLSWSSQSVGTSNYVETVFFINSQEGWVAGGYGSGNAFIFHTTDGGANWSAQSPAASNHILTSYFVNRNLGFVTTLNGVVEKTTDGGATWTAVQNTGHYYTSDILMKDALQGWFTAYNYWGSSPGEDGRGFIYVTTDGGNTWVQEYRSPRIRTFLNGLGRQSTAQYWSCGGHSHILKYQRTGIEDEGGERLASGSLSVWPNPCRGQTTIRFSILVGARNSSLQIFDASGRCVKTLASGSSLIAHRSVLFTWDGSDDVGRPVSAGVYFCRAKAGGQSLRTKILLLR